MAPKLQQELSQSKPFSSTAEEALLALVRTADRISLAEERFFREHDITPTQYNVLRILRGAGEEGRTCKELRQRLISHVPDVTRLLDRMEREGWIERARNRPDRRIVTTTLTPSGRALVDKLDKPVEQFIQNVMGGVDESHLGGLISVLEEMRAKLE